MEEKINIQKQKYNEIQKRKELIKMDIDKIEYTLKELFI